MKMRMLAVLFGLFALTGATGCSSVAPNAGEEAVLVYKPWLFGSGGIDSTPVKTGRIWIVLSTEHVIVNVQPEQHPSHFEDFMSSDGVPLDFDSVARLQVTDSVRLVKEFGPKWYENNFAKEFENRVRQAVRKHGMNETAIDTKAINDIDTEVTAGLEEYIKKANLPVRLVDMTVGKANPPDAIKNQRVETAAQQQRQLTEQQKKLAEDQRKMAEESRAKADNAYREAMQLTPEQFLRLETIKMQKAVCGGADEKGGKGTCTFFIGSGNMPVPTINAGK